MRELHERNGPSRLPAVADELSGRALSGQRSSERREDDERAAQGSAREYPAILPAGRDNFRRLSAATTGRERDERLTRDRILNVAAGPDMRSRLLRHVEADEELQEAALLPLLLSRDRAGAPEVRADRLEQSVRVQRDGSAYQRAAAEDLPRPVRRRAVHRVEVPHG